MAFKVVFWAPIQGHYDIEVSSVNITNNMLTKGKFSTPITNIKYIQDLS